MEAIDLEDVPLRLLVVVQRQPDGGWAQLGGVAEQARMFKQLQGQAAAAGPPAAAPPAPPAEAAAAPQLARSPVPAAVVLAVWPPHQEQLPGPEALADMLGDLRVQPVAQPGAGMPLRPMQLPAAAAPQERSPPPKPAAPALAPRPRGSSTRRRSLLACPACNSVRRGATAAEAAAVLTCPVCFCEVEPPEHTHLDCGHPCCNPCLANYLHASYQGGAHPKCQRQDCAQVGAQRLDAGGAASRRCSLSLPPLQSALEYLPIPP